MAEQAILFDATKCTACRGCQVACKQWNDLPAVSTTFFAGPGYQNPAGLSYMTLTLMEFFTDAGNDLVAPTGTWPGDWLFLKYQCMHCKDAACLCACYYARGPTNVAITRDVATGFLYIDETKCNGCGACVSGYGGHPGCPFGAGIPKPAPGPGVVYTKCHACLAKSDATYNRGWKRITYQYPAQANLGHVGGPTTIKANLPLPDSTTAMIGQDLIPACVTSCPTGALEYGLRGNPINPGAGTMIKKARLRKSAVQAKYPQVSVYGDDGPYGGLHVIMVLPMPPSFYSLPAKVQILSPACGL